MLDGISGCDSALRKIRCSPVVIYGASLNLECGLLITRYNSIYFHIVTAQVAA